jgi:hypothetical protein
MSGESHKLSTSALAKQLDIPLQQLFGTLRDYGWIRKLDDGWALTPKGEFEGGEYVHSKRYGRYIVWPETLPEHPLLQGMAENRLLTATQIGRKFGLHAREVRRLLGEIGLLQRGRNGWEVSARGEELGGVLMENEGQDGEINWPETLLQNALVATQMEYGQRLEHDDNHGEGDLLEAISDYESLDGHHFASRGEWQICNWLYLAGILHACRRRLPWHEPLYADFWLPEFGLYIEYNGDERDGAALTAALQRQEIYRQQQWPVIEVRAEHLSELDDMLTRELRRRGVRVW